MVLDRVLVKRLCPSSTQEGLDHENPVLLGVESATLQHVGPDVLCHQEHHQTLDGRHVGLVHEETPECRLRGRGVPRHHLPLQLGDGLGWWRRWHDWFFFLATARAALRLGLALLGLALRLGLASARLGRALLGR